MKYSMHRIAVPGILIFLFLVAVCQRPYAQNADASQAFTTELVWEARVTIADPVVLGASKHGERRMIPITGGTFKGPRIQGMVLPFGEDWQLVRKDGDTELYARYILKTSDGHLIHVINRALVHMPAKTEKGTPYVRSVLDIEAPVNSPYDYLNHAIFLGTLAVPQLKQGEKPYVIIGVYRVL